MKKLLIYILFICNLLPAFGQKDGTARYLYWADIGAGSYISNQKESGESLNISFNLVKNTTLYKIRYSKHNEILSLGPLPTEQYSCLGVLVGKGIDKKYGSLYFSAGLGMTGGAKRGKYLAMNGGIDHYESLRFLSPSIPLEIDAKGKLRYAGIGMTYFADLNLSRPLVGLVLNIAVGKMRE